MKLSIKCDWCGKEFHRDSKNIHTRNHFCIMRLGKENAEREGSSWKLC